MREAQQTAGFLQDKRIGIMPPLHRQRGKGGRPEQRVNAAALIRRGFSL
jgi:hypothetical protein